MEKDNVCDCGKRTEEPDCYEWWLAQISRLPGKKKRRLREAAGSAEEVYYIEEKRLASYSFLTEKEVEMVQNSRKVSDPVSLYEEGRRKRIQLVPYYVPEYPQRLSRIQTPPYALYVRGRLPEENRKSAAIVGARQCSPYGRKMALEFGEVLSRHGVQIISGMARGIDGAGQRGALNVGGDSYGVLGCGADVCYPREHIGLFMDLQKDGGILSEQSVGAAPLKEHFPARNRIISGLSDIILVMEAKEKSGSLITADFALEQGKEVYALPGPVTSPLSSGCNYLIRQGAGILLSPEDLLMEMGLLPFSNSRKNRNNSDKNKIMLESTENMVYSCLDLSPKSISALAEETALLPSVLLDKLISLELKGYAKELSKNYYLKVE